MGVWYFKGPFISFQPLFVHVKGSNLFLNETLKQWFLTFFIMGCLFERKKSLNAGLLMYPS